MTSAPAGPPGSLPTICLPLAIQRRKVLRSGRLRVRGSGAGLPQLSTARPYLLPRRLLWRRSFHLSESTTPSASVCDGSVARRRPSASSTRVRSTGRSCGPRAASQPSLGTGFGRLRTCLDSYRLPSGPRLLSRCATSGVSRSRSRRPSTGGPRTLIAAPTMSLAAQLQPRLVRVSLRLAPLAFLLVLPCDFAVLLAHSGSPSALEKRAGRLV
jgi:hypothetical protein